MSAAAVGVRRRRRRQRAAHAPASAALRRVLLVLLVACALPARGGASASFWQDLTPAAFGPGARQGGAAAYCDALDAPLFFGGLVDRTGAASDAWVFAVGARAWVPVSQSGDGVAGRYGHSLSVIRDAADECVLLLYGGEGQGADAFLGRLRAADGADGGAGFALRWSRFTPDGDSADGGVAPGARAFHAAVSVPGADDNATAAVLLLGGDRACDAAQDSAWRLHVTVPVSASGAPRGRWERVQVPTGAAPPCLWMLSGARLDASTVAFFGGNSVTLGPVADRVRTRKQLWLLQLSPRLAWEAPPQRSDGAAFQRYGHVSAAAAGSLFVHGGARYHFQTDAPQSPFFLYYFNSLLQTRPRDARSPQRSCRGADFRAVAGDSELFCEPRDMAADDGVGPDCRTLHLAVQRRDALLLFGGQADHACARSSSLALRDVWQANLTLALRGEWVEARDDDAADASVIINAVFYLFGGLLVLAAVAAARVMRRRRRNRRARGASGGSGGSGCPGGASSEAIRGLPVARFKDVAELGRDRGETACPICLGEYAPEDEVIVLPCGHAFHPDCAETWLVKSDLCPLCKTSVCARPVAGAAAAARQVDIEMVATV